MAGRAEPPGRGAAPCAAVLAAAARADLQRDRFVFADADELAYVLARIECGVPTAFARWGDGEWALATGGALGEAGQNFHADGFTWPGGPSRLGAALRRALALGTAPDGRAPDGGGAPPLEREGFFFAVPCPDWPALLDPLLRALHPAVATRHLSYATVFINANYPAFRAWFSGHVLGGLARPVLVVNEEAAARLNGGGGGAPPPWARAVVGLPADGVRWWEREGARTTRWFASLARAHAAGQLFLLAVGPMANALVLAGWAANPLNVYIDVGSALDEVLKGRRTRPYMDPASRYAAHRCVPRADGRGRLGRRPRVTDEEATQTTTTAAAA